MKAVVRLMMTYFGGTPFLCWTTLTGLAMVLAGTGALLHFPEYLFAGPEAASGIELAIGALLWMIPTAGLAIVFLGSSLMPIMFGRFMFGHHLYVLPHGRLKILISALLTVAILALIFALIATALYSPYPIDRRLIFGRALASSFPSFSLMYAVIWFVTRARSAVGLLGGGMFLVATFAIPLQFIQISSTSLKWPLTGGALAIGLSASLLLLGPRLKNWLEARQAQLTRQASDSYVSSSTSGREFELIMGMGRPWMLALGQVFPILVATQFISSPGVWLFYFALFSAISGAVASLAAARSRCLWLRAGESRVYLFKRIEASFWRHHSYSLSVLLLLLVAIGSYLGFQTSLLAFGLPLLIICTTVATYLGLMMTRGIGWWDSTFAVCTMLLIMAAAVYAADSATYLPLLVGIDALLVVLAFSFRAAAKRRWAKLDWMLCRLDLGSLARSPY